MRKLGKTFLTVLILLLSAFFVQLEQYIIWHHPWDIDQILHHETLSVLLIGLAAGIIIGKYMNRKV